MPLMEYIDPANPKNRIPFDGRIGTRGYDLANMISRTTLVAAADSGAIPAGVTEVMLCASKACYFRVQAAAGTAATAANGIPLADNEKFHLRVTPGQVINAIRSTEDGTLKIIPVA